MSILVVAEHDSKKLNTNTYKTINAALQINAEVEVLVAGNHIESIEEEASKFRA